MPVLESPWGIMVVSLARTTRRHEAVNVEYPHKPALTPAKWHERMDHIADMVCTRAHSLFFSQHYDLKKMRKANGMPDSCVQTYVTTVCMGTSMIEQIQFLPIVAAVNEARRNGWPLDLFLKRLKVIFTIEDRDDVNHVSFRWVDAKDVKDVFCDPTLVRVDDRGFRCKAWVEMEAWRLFAGLPELPVDAAKQQAFADDQVKKLLQHAQGETPWRDVRVGTRPVSITEVPARANTSRKKKGENEEVTAARLRTVVSALGAYFNTQSGVDGARERA